MRLIQITGINILMMLTLWGMVAFGGYLGYQWIFQDTSRELPVVEVGVATRPETLRITIPVGERVPNVTITGDFGPPASGSSVFAIGETGGETLDIETLTITGMACRSFTVSELLANTLTVKNNSHDGMTDAAISTTTPMIVMASTRGDLGNRDASGKWDKLVIEGGGQIRNLTLTDVKTRGGDCTLTGVNTGTTTITGGQFGSGTGINFPNFILSTSTQGSTVDTAPNTEVPGLDIR